MNHGLILFAHGARDPRWALPFEAVAARVRAARPGVPVRLAYLEFMAPSLPDAGAELARAGCTRIEVVPMFLGAMIMGPLGGWSIKKIDGLLEEREAWKCLQRFFIEHFCEPIFGDWLKSSLSMGAIEVVNGTLPASKFEKFHAPEFRGRRWPWVDPKKDIEASMMAIDAGLTSRRAAIGEAGGDIYEIFREQQADKELAAEMGLSFDTEQKTNAGPQKGNAPQGADD
jgi:sirohydrochlorin cobaltochelatase